MSIPGYIAGDFWRICDVCGFRYRSSETMKRWDGVWVCAADYEARHPQDFVRGRKDRQVVPEPRPEHAAVFVSGADLDIVITSDGEQVVTSNGDIVVI